MWCWFDIIIDAHTEYVSYIIRALVWNAMKRKLPLPYPRCEGPCLPLDLIPYSLWKVFHQHFWAFSNTARLFFAYMSNLKMYWVSLSGPTWWRQYVAFSPDQHQKGTSFRHTLYLKMYNLMMFLLLVRPMQAFQTHWNLDFLVTPTFCNL